MYIHLIWTRERRKKQIFKLDEKKKKIEQKKRKRIFVFVPSLHAIDEKCQMRETHTYTRGKEKEFNRRFYREREKKKEYYPQKNQAKHEKKERSVLSVSTDFSFSRVYLFQQQKNLF